MIIAPTISRPFAILINPTVFTSAPKKSNMIDSNRINSAKLAISKMTLLAFLLRSFLYTARLINKPKEEAKKIVHITESQKFRLRVEKRKSRKYAEEAIVAPWAKWTNLQVE